MNRAPPGPQLAVGRLRVDAARAIAKLREYQLADRTAWILEAIRAAVAARATEIELRGDANDVWLAWHGDPWPAEDLPRLFDELVSPEPTSERHHVRLLAAAINSALGSDPAHVDVFAVAQSTVMRARYTPDVLDEPTSELAAPKLRTIVAEPAKLPAGFEPFTGMLVHLRRRTSLAMISYLFWNREPRELHLARSECRDIAVPLRIGSEVYSRATNPADIARLPLDDAADTSGGSVRERGSGALDGFVALLDPAEPRPPGFLARLEIAERGVVLARYPFGLRQSEGRTAVPIRLFVDAPRMPTNASRSEVRRDSHPIAEAERRGPAIVERLIRQLAQQLAKDPSSRVKRDAALALLASAITGPRWADEARQLVGALGELANVPIVRDATGAPLPVAGSWAFAHTGQSPLPEKLARWLRDVIWVPPGDPAERLVPYSETDSELVVRRLRWARRQHRAHRKFFAHSPRVPLVVTSEVPRVRMTLGAEPETSCIEQRFFDGLTGEIALYPARTDGELVILLEGRELERIRLVSAIGFEAVIDAPEITPADRYRGVTRNLASAAVELAARRGIVRAVEALAVAIAGGELPAGFTVGPFGVRDEEARVIRKAMLLADVLGAQIQAPLATAQVWRTIDDRFVSLAYLRTLTVAGVAFAPRIGAGLVPKDRVVLDAGPLEQDLLARFLPALRLVRYDGGRRVCRVDPLDVAKRLQLTFALAVRDGDLIGAIAPALVTSVVRLQHVGVPLAEVAYTPRLLDACTIVVDSDAIVPGDDWRSVLDDAGLGTRDYVEWERSLVKAAAAALIGARPPELLGGHATFDGDLGRLVCAALARQGTRVGALLEPDVVTRLRATPLVRLLGRPELRSLNEVSATFPLPAAIPYVDRDSIPVDGFTPLLGDRALADAVEKLTGRDVRDAASELELHRLSSIRRLRLTAHRGQPERPLAFPSDAELPGELAQAVALGDVLATGIVRVGRERLVIQVLVEGRPFLEITRPEDLPLEATVELAAKHADTTFEGLPTNVEEQLIATVQRAARPLLLSIVKDYPVAIAMPGPVRTLLAMWANRNAKDLKAANRDKSRTKADREVREALCEAAAFLTVQGTRISIEQASQPRDILQIAQWSGDWLPPDTGEAASAFDGHVLQVSALDGEDHVIFKHLHAGAVVDVTPEITKLQARRRMARGLIPMPALPHVHGSLKRRLADLGVAGKAFGVGEIGLVEYGTALALLHHEGELRERVPLEVWPTIELAIEMPEGLGSAKPDDGDTIADQLGALRRARESGQLEVRPVDPRTVGLSARAQELAVLLVCAVLESSDPAMLSHAIRRNLRRAVLAGKLVPGILGKLPVFETAGGGWVNWDAVQQQFALFDEVWAVSVRLGDQQPLDDRRIVLLLSDDERAGAPAAGFPIVDGTHELALDATARRNRARPLARSLELEPRGVLAEVSLPGDGISGPRGVVAVLAPSAADRRGVHAHRAMHPFDVRIDPCRWPTLTMIDDARFTPDRTWERPATNPFWHATVEQIRAASETALAGLVTPPDDAIVVERVIAMGLGTPAAEIRGALWLAGAPRSVDSCVVQVMGTSGTQIYVPPGDSALGGSLIIHSQVGVQALTLENVCVELHAKLLRALGRGETISDLGLAHLAHGLALGRIVSSDVEVHMFPCFRPRSLDASGLGDLLRRKDPVRIVGLADDPEIAGVVDDDSALSRVVIRWLGVRGVRGPELPRQPVRPPRIAAPPQSPPEPEHPVKIVAEAIYARLVALGVSVPIRGGSALSAPARYVIVDREEPIVRFDRVLQLAGENPRLLAIANACRVTSPWAPQAIDAVVAHTITVLNLALTQITDATESAALQALLEQS